MSYNNDIKIKRIGELLMEENENLEQELDLNQLMKVRREKLAKLQEEGKNPFEITKFVTTHNS